VQIRPWGASGQMGEIQRIFFIYNFFPMNSNRLIFTLDGSNDADSHKGVPFGGFVDTAPHFGVKSPKTPILNSRFQTKLAKY